jgi:hypothetical protein
MGRARRFPLGSCPAPHEIEQRIAETTARFRGHTCIAAFLVGNEIEKTLVRWMQPERVRDFIEKLIDIAREQAPQTLISYATIRPPSISCRATRTSSR